MAEICATLVRDPFRLSMADIRQMTTYQLLQVYFRAKKEDGQPRGEMLSYRQVFDMHWKKQGLTPEEIEAKWKEEGHDQEVSGGE